MNTILKTTTYACLLFVAAACSSSQPVLIGSVNSISSRNIDTSANYELLKRYAGSGNKEVTRNAATTIDAAMENVIKSTPGGEYLMNVKIYKVEEKYSIEGDVWGIASKSDIRGFRVNDEVVFKRSGKVTKGFILGLIDSQKCYVRFKDDRGKDIDREMKYDDLSK
jgi:hypothetical protein